MLSINLKIEPPVIAHRGMSRFAPENTLAAFRKAKEFGINWVEFDVMLTADGEAVVIHDETLERTTNGKGQVISHPFSYIKTLDAGSWFDPQFKGEKIPTLREVIELLNELKLNANIEIKAQVGNEELTVRTVLGIIQQFWKNKHTQPLISSFSLTILKWVREYSPTVMMGFLMHEWNADWQPICDALLTASVNVNQEILTPENVELIKATNRKLLAYTVNEPNRAHELFAWGVDAVFSDDPIRILSH